MQLSVRRSLVWLLSTPLSLFVLQFGGSVIIARLLTPYERGVYGAAAAIFAIVTTLRIFGLQTFVVRERELDARAATTVFTINALLGLLTSALILILSRVGQASFGDPAVEQVLSWLALGPIISIF